MLVYHQLKISFFHTEEELTRKISQLLHIKTDEIIQYEILKKSIDARKKPIVYSIYSILITLKDEKQVLKKNRDRNLKQYQKKEYKIPTCGTKKMLERPVVIGAGPSGLFATLLLAKQGFKPILLERGKAVEERTKDVDTFWKTGALDENSNVQFGEGGAGTFSDGKLNTQVKDKNHRMHFILDEFFENGADVSIVSDSKPHVGTDQLKTVIVNMRKEIIALGGEVRFESQVTNFFIQDQKLNSLEINGKDILPVSHCILAIGHSARDTFTVLHKNKVPMEKKNFSIGLRVEHQRKMIDSLQYGDENFGKIPSASYKLATQTKQGKGVYSFCVCPGGVVINASSEKNRLVINGMSYFARNGKNTNSAIVVQVDETDIPNEHPLSGMYFQQELEELAYAQGNGAVIVQRYEDFCKNQDSKIEDFTYLPRIKGAYQVANIRKVLPAHISECFMEGMHYFGTKMKDFDNENTILSGIETRTSSPVRILRNKDFQSDIKGLYPTGEGAGYAGGIISAAMDGMKIAEEIIQNYESTQ